MEAVVCSPLDRESGGGVVVDRFDVASLPYRIVIRTDPEQVFFFFIILLLFFLLFFYFIYYLLLFVYLFIS